MSRPVRIGVSLAAVGVGLLVLILSAPQNAGSGGFVALHRFLPAMGIQVQESERPPSAGTFLLLADDRNETEENALLSWVQQGGRLVVTDPRSELFSRFGVSSNRAGVYGTTVLTPGCVRTEVAGVRTVEVSAADRVLLSSIGAGCFAVGSESYALFVPRGEGDIVLTGGSSFLTDRLLNHADNGAFAIGLLGAGGGPVVLGPPAPAGAGERGLLGLLPSGARSVAWQLAVAVLVFALARGRRLGAPVAETVLSPIPSGELVRATARLYRRARASAYCAELVRRSTVDRVARRAGVSPELDPSQLADTIARAASMDTRAIERAFAGRAPANDEELVALCRELETVAERIEGVG